MTSAESKMPTIRDFIDNAPMRGLVLRVPILCGMLMLIEGLDTYGVGYVNNDLMAEYGIDPAVMGMIHAGTVVASLIGALFVAPLSDRFGRRPLLLSLSLLMAVCTFLTAFASNELELVVVRFLIGIGFGAAVPTAFSMVSDFAPARHKSLVIMMTMSGIALGMAIAGVLAAALIPMFGWRSILILSAALSVIWVAVLAFTLPESPFHLARTGAHSRYQKLIGKLAHDRGVSQPPELFMEADKVAAKVGVREAFSGERKVDSALLWLAMSAAYALEFFTSYWLPTVIMNSGADIVGAGLLTALGKVGSIVGAVLIGVVMDRRGAARTLIVTYGLTAISVMILGWVSFSVVLAVTFIFITFMLLDGSFAGIQATTATSFPSHLRATGIGWVSGLARLIGGGGGTLAGGVIVGRTIEVGAIAVVMAFIMAIGCCALVILHMRWRSRGLSG